MKTFAQHLQDLQATRKAKEDAQTAVARKGVDEGRSLNTAEQAEFDSLDAEIKSLDADIARTSTMAAREKASAAPITDPAGQTTPGTALAPVQIKNTQKLEPGMGFARIARVKALAHIDHSSPIEIAKSVYPGDELLLSAITKAAVPAANTLNGPWAGNLVLDGGAYFADFVEFLRARSVLGQVSGRFRQLPFDTNVLVQGTGGTGKWTSEGQAKPLTQWTYSSTKLAPLKVAAIAAATKETLMRASIAADTLLRDELARAVNAAIDTTFVSDSAAVTNTSPAGIRNGTVAITLTGDGSVEGIRCDAAAMLKSLAGNNLSVAGSFWIMSETTAIDLSAAVNTMGNLAFPGMTPTGGTFMGLPAFTSQYLPTDSNGTVVMLIKGDEVFMGDEGGVQLAMSDQASLVMDDSPAHNSITPTATAVVSMFQTNSVAFLAERFMNWQKRRSTAVVWANANWNPC
jgi:hypothetical protein